MSRRDRIVFVGLGVLLVVLSLLSNTSARRDARDLRTSSYLSSPGGTAALFLAMEELGLEPERRLTAYVDGDSLRGPLALLAPSEPPSPAELHALADWVRAGGTLLYAARPDDPTLDTLGVTLDWIGPDSLSPAQRRRWPGMDALPEAHPLTEGLRATGGFRYALSLPDGARVEPLLAGDGAVVAAQLRFGRGRVVAFSDARPLLNRTVAEGDAAALFARAAALNGDRVYFDEYHHGFREGGNAAVATLRYLARTPLGNAFAQLAVAALGLLLLLGTRFGSALPPPPVRRRDPLEHVSALAEAYRRAGARRTARRLLLHGLLRRLGRHAAPGAEQDEVFETLRRATPPGAHGSVDALAAEWAKGDHASLVTLARHMDRIVMETRKR